MDIKVYKQLREKIYTDTLENGLRVKLIPKNEFKKTYAVLFTDFGSIDQSFIPYGKKNTIVFPPGVAHFLEHQLFETEKGDISNIFSGQGASVNAYTSNTKTAFLCSFTSNIKQNIETLLDFIQHNKFDPCAVENEKSIILQEIQMYKDDPDWILSSGLIENLYPNHPLSYDVAGTEESIPKISVKMLQENYDTFYHPANMQLIVIGNLDPQETMNWIKDNQKLKSFQSLRPIKRMMYKESEAVIPDYREMKVSVNMPKVLVGVKGNQHKSNEKTAFRKIIQMEILLDLLFGDTSSTYLSLYNDELLDDSFSYDYIFDRGFDYVSIGGDSKYPEELAESIKYVLVNNQYSPDMTATHFSLIKKKLIGQYIQELDSLEFIAQCFVDSPYEHYTIFDSLSVLDDITFEEVKSLAQEFFNEKVISVFSIKPKED